MPFWNKKKTEAEKAAAQAEASRAAENSANRQKEQRLSLKALEAGDIPAQARQRMEQQLHGSQFTSTFSPKEYFLARQGGYEPVAQVMGAAFIKMPIPVTTYSTREIYDHTQANRTARNLAVERMRKEAAVLSADGIISVRIESKQYSWSENVIEFTASGTAIRVPGQASWRTRKQCPFASTLSGQEFWQLYQAGYWPVGLVMGNCTYCIVDVSSTSNASKSFRAGKSQIAAARKQNFDDLIELGSGINEEITIFQEGFSDARRFAMDRMTAEMKQLGARGVVDVDIEYKLHVSPIVNLQYQYGHMMCEFMAIGTAVIEREATGKKPSGARPLIVIDLAKRAKKNLEFDVEMQE